MKRFSIVALILSACFVCGTPAAKGGFDPGTIKAVDRTVLYRNIVHYRFKLVVGQGEFDVIQVHRIVKEPQPRWPERTKDAVLLLPGLPTYFEGLFVEPLISAAELSLASRRGALSSSSCRVEAFVPMTG